MAAVKQADRLKAMQDVQGKITEVQQTARVQRMANEASREALKKDIKQMTEGVAVTTASKRPDTRMQTLSQRLPILNN